MADFNLFNNAAIGGTIADTPKEGEFNTTYGGKVLTIKARVVTTDKEHAKQVYCDINFPHAFRSDSRTSFDTGGNLTVKGTLSSWIPDANEKYNPRSFLSVRTNGAIQKDVNAGAVGTSKSPMFKNEANFWGVRVSSPLTEGEEFDSPDKTDGNIYYLANSERNGRRNVIGVLLEEVPDGFLDDDGAHTVWAVEGKIDSVTLAEGHWTDVIRPSSGSQLTEVGSFKEVSQCTVPCDSTSNDGDETPSDDDVPF